MEKNIFEMGSHLSQADLELLISFLPLPSAVITTCTTLRR